MRIPEIYVSTDIEADGPIPGENSMLSFASAAYTRDKQLVGTFSENLDTLPHATTNPDTQAFWERNPKAYKACRANTKPAEVAMPAYAQWLTELPGKPIFVGFPATFDFMFVYWYLIKFHGSSPFSFSAIDIKTYAMAVLNCDYKKTAKQHLPKEWFDELPHTHVALDDAIEQGALFCNILAARDKA